MFVLRYVVLVALVLWLGAMVTTLLAGPSPDLLRVMNRLAPLCGAVVLLGLVAIKFLGPPPHAFPLRAIVAAGMLAIWLYGWLPPGRAMTTTLTGIDVVAGLFLLSFYVRE